MRRILRRASAVGLALGAFACAYCLLLEYRARTAPDGSDAPMAAALMFDVAARPLSYVTGDVLYERGLGSSVLAASGQVLLNWVLLALVGGTIWATITAGSRRGASNTP